VNGRNLRISALAGFAAVCAALSGSLAPTYAQTAPAAPAAPALGSWTAGPDGAGAATIIGRIESPVRTQNVASGASLLLSGWAADTTAAGWSGIDGVEVWSGAKDKGGTKLATGMVGLTRADVGDFLGAYFGKAGFNAVVPSSALTALTPGATTVYVYLHTPGKGTWYRTAGFNLGAPAAPLAFANDPVLVISRPQDGMAITQKQPNNRFSFNGFALDRNTINNQTIGPGCSACTLFSTQSRPAGISAVTLYIDSPRGDPIFPNFGAPCASCVQTNSPLVSNKGDLNRPGRPQASLQSRQYGTAYDFSGWSAAINPTTLAPGNHTLYVTATSAITGKSTTGSVNFQILDMNHTRVQP
jgi:hypothetical protein